jgi:hypothetical protein
VNIFQGRSSPGAAPSSAEPARPAWRRREGCGGLATDIVAAMRLRSHRSIPADSAWTITGTKQPFARVTNETKAGPSMVGDNEAEASILVREPCPGGYRPN